MPMLLRIITSLLPVLVFLGGLIVFDSFKLIRFRVVLQALLFGALAALVSLLITQSLFHFFAPDLKMYARYVAPVFEESCKALYVIYLIKRSRVGFLVDSAILGFALGAGFACVENIYYLQALDDSNILLWLIRGFGTAMMHGGVTAIFAILSRQASDRAASTSLRIFLFPLLAVIVLHSFFNHFFLPPVLSTVTLLLALPLLMAIVFQRSEIATRHWLELGFDTDQELLDLLTTEKMSGSRIGAYLQSLRQTFPGEIMADILCWLRLRLELSIKAKGFLLLREAGFTPAPDPEISSAFEELRYLEKSIGKTGMLALKPFVSVSNRELWQLQLLQQKL